MKVRSAQDWDMKEIILFLRQAGLEAKVAENKSENFLILEEGSGNIEGTLGMEQLGRYCLLRSFAVSSKATKENLLILFEKALKQARNKGAKRIYLAVNKPESVELFSLLGFSIEEKSSLPAELLQSDHAKQAFNVDNSIFMGLNVN